MTTLMSNCIVALCLLFPAALLAADDSASVKPFKPAVVIHGTAHERGVAYGKEFRAGIREFLDKEIYTAFVDKSFAKADMLHYAAECGKVVREVCPMVADEIAGIAEGAGIELNEVLLIHLHEELYHRSALPKHGHCTAVAVNAASSGDRHAYAGQTWDWMTSVAVKSSISEWQRGKDDVNVLAYGYPGMPVGAGINANGIALCWTSGALSRKGQSPRVGVPSYALIAHLLNQKDLESVIREAKRDKHAGWFTFVINDADGNMLNIEGSPSGVVIERATGNHMIRADYGTDAMKKELTTAVKKWQPPARVATFQKLLEQTAGKNNRVQIQKYLSDPKLGIAFAGRPRNMTIDAMLFDTTTRKAYVTRGPDYGIDWREFGFTIEK